MPPLYERLLFVVEAVMEGIWPEDFRERVDTEARFRERELRLSRLVVWSHGGDAADSEGEAGGGTPSLAET